MVKPIENRAVEPAPNRRAVLWGEDDVLSQAIVLLLESNMTWDVIRVSRKRGVDDLVKEIRRINPEVVILCEDKVGENSTLPLRLINEQRCLTVISLGLESNLMQVYSKQEVILEGVSDLLSIVESSYFPKRASAKEVGS